ncbi:TetR family transcriptional regulator [Bifidobacterium simiarum]|uniref:TetR/AcrR family transcriptional regulator n=1 Tax=Bifidobacterium simiarum TaxID=2045441 RepID=UPI001BDC4808|nr:TetR family transcriptional regulator [Bifidobacterium simiarum]MBT1165987.1 TetR family transcriptional regulator [Bifidobacterium simiarum]
MTSVGEHVVGGLDDVNDETGGGLNNKAVVERPEKGSADHETGGTNHEAGGSAARPESHRRRGRRPGNSPSRQRILDAACEEFSAHGYRGTTLKGVAAAAGVDAKLVKYYYTDKETLFMAAASELFRSQEFFNLLHENKHDHTMDSTGSRLVYAFLMQAVDPRRRLLLGLLKDLGANEEFRNFYVRFLKNEIVNSIQPPIDDRHAAERLGLVFSQIIGLVSSWHLIEIPALRRHTVLEMAKIVGPVIDHYLYDDLPFDE